jgi:hypothetical protein
MFGGPDTFWNNQVQLGLVLVEIIAATCRVLVVLPPFPFQSVHHVQGVLSCGPGTAMNQKR